ncbi:TetR/AcrR family transcriptional regulator [Paenibacillus sp. XY044]|uniref:TetR/AcrR family transcriptional regulator n=1 Tax=Paenibacillus sp. XY044 TaxID=2026089 RepID=UPI000B993112|nr:TetR/AcrR family transcriptional regulator [Paenibacillus sp. XY044]OZB95185.1 hypothetical protein CJP46_15965 [Paenibacillus sp. XY044]
MASTDKNGDRRIERTRQLLRQGFVEMIREKGFSAMSVQDIAERANVSRGTFYIHYTDKYMLLDHVIRDNFGKLLLNTVPPNTEWNRETARRIIIAVLQCFEGKYGHRQPSSRVPVSILEETIRKELTRYIFEWMRNEPDRTNEDPLRLNARASVVSWAILGPAIQWAREPQVLSEEQMADVILSVVDGGRR